jgi:hypothetical protein
MREYELFGGRLRSDIPFPELEEAESGPTIDWQLRVTDAAVSRGPARLLGTLRPGKELVVRLWKHAAGYRVEYSDTGYFDITENGRYIDWTPRVDSSVDAARLDLLGIVLAVALHARGTLTLHGSAVATADGVVAFIGPRLHGKSTLAAAMVAAGAWHVTDDTLAVSLTPGGILAAPGVHATRLWNDAVAQLPTDLLYDVTMLNGKRMLRYAQARSANESLPLAAIYVLQPTVEPTSRAARRSRLAPLRAALALAAEAKLAVLFDGSAEAGAVLMQAAAVAQSVPVFALDIARDWTRLGDVVGTMLQWHPLREPVAAPATEGGGV